MSEIIKFPTAPLAKNVQRHFVEMFARMTEMGMTAQQQWNLIAQTCKEMGLIEVNGVWQEPPSEGEKP